MKKFLALAVLMGIAVLPAFAQQEIRSEGSLDFSKADLSGNLTVKMIRSDTARIAIKLQDAEINRLNWGVKDGLLTVRLKPGMNGKGSADVTLYYDSLSSVKVSGANVSVAGVLSAVMLDIDLSAGATFGAELATKDTYMKVAGNSVANVTGTTKYFTLVAGARSKVDCRALTAEDVRVEAGCRSLCERDRTSSDDCRYRGRDFLQGFSGDPPVFVENAGNDQQYRAIRIFPVAEWNLRCRPVCGRHFLTIRSDAGIHNGSGRCAVPALRGRHIVPTVGIPEPPGATFLLRCVEFVDSQAAVAARFR